MNKLKHNRITSFTVIIIIYILAIITSVFTYKLLPFDWWLNLLLSDIAATILTFIFSLILKNSSVYDAYWSVQPMVILIGFSMGKHYERMKKGHHFDICYHFEENYWNGKVETQLNVKDIRFEQ